MDIPQSNADKGILETEGEWTLQERDREVQRLRIKNAKLRLKLRVQQNMPRRAYTVRSDRKLHIASLRRRRNVAKFAQKPQRDELASSVLVDALCNMTPIVSVLSSLDSDDTRARIQDTGTQQNMQAEFGHITLRKTLMSHLA